MTFLYVMLCADAAILILGLWRKAKWQTISSL
jgi:hypothetical protein